MYLDDLHTKFVTNLISVFEFKVCVYILGLCFETSHGILTRKIRLTTRFAFAFIVYYKESHKRGAGIVIRRVYLLGN
jgi:hypothetical protein